MRKRSRGKGKRGSGAGGEAIVNARLVYHDFVLACLLLFMHVYFFAGFPFMRFRFLTAVYLWLFVYSRTSLRS